MTPIITGIAAILLAYWGFLFQRLIDEADPVHEDMMKICYGLSAILFVICLLTTGGEAGLYQELP